MKTGRETKNVKIGRERDNECEDRERETENVKTGRERQRM